ncbi:ADP-ribosylglycohydrolase family protein [Terribacillus saccharophilus]|uniref:ADP-ribosylglycohydrolase family protein n=1 Tax=Terribacillus saccharophilus TaxID=361277 RepID=UPI002DD4057B|nr:ADP-ribosylglycohydrolase family protein [Terribacillus saccharophilus]
MVDRWNDDNKIYLALKIKERVLPTMYGGILGDLIGVPVEFKERGTFNINDITGYGTYNQPPGTWSDDTSLTLCLVENIVEKGNIDSLMNKLVRYRDSGYFTPFDKTFDIGIATSKSIERYKNKVPAPECGGNSEYDNGNGAIMRISPLAFLLHNDFNFKRKSDIIKQYTEITHTHPRSIVGSIIYVELLLRLFHNNSLTQSLADIKELFYENFDRDHIYRKELYHYKRIFEEDFLELLIDEISYDGYVVHTLEAAIWSFGNADNFKDAILTAVNLGDDTDTVASITGSLAGMYYKMDAIPNEWLEKIVRKSDIDDLLEKFYEFCANKSIIEKFGSPLN